MEHLQELFGEARSVLIAYSGGVDSTFLLTVAQDVLREHVTAVTAVSRVHPSHELQTARRFLEQKHIRYLWLESEEMALPVFTANNPDRCYHCKKALFQQLNSIAASKGIRRVAHGANVDDLSDHRPGLQAAREMNIWAPLVETGFAKEDIREASKEWGLPTWDKPSGACLATRIPYGSAITDEKLDRVEKAECFLLQRGLRLCRVRHHGAVARIETDVEGMKRLMENDLKQAVVSAFRNLGFLHVALDLEYYESGRMNRAIDRKPDE
jgi:uncharacterized protein